MVSGSDDRGNASFSARGRHWLDRLPAYSRLRAQGVATSFQLSPVRVVVATIPTLAFYASHRWLALDARTAVAAGLASAVVLALIAVLGRRPPLPAWLGALAMTIPAGLVLITGSASDYFLPGIVLRGAYALIGILSVLIGYPVARLGRHLLVDPERLGTNPPFAAITVIWSAKFGLETAVMTYVYLTASIDALLLTRIALRTPSTAVCVLLTFYVIRRSGRRRGASHS